MSTLKPTYNFQYFQILIFLLMVCASYGQKEPQYTQYMYNIGSFNPAYVGSVERPEIALLYRAQWVDIPGAPKTLRLGGNFPMANAKNGLGFNVISDQLGPTSQTYFDVAYSFQVNVSDNAYLSFGIDAGGALIDVDFSKGLFEKENEPLISTNEYNSFSPTVGAGIFLYGDNGYLGFSIPNFLTNVISDPELKSWVNDDIQFNFIAGYVFEITDSFKFKPAVMAHMIKGLSTKVDMSANFLIRDTFTLGGSYRTDKSISGLAGVQVSKGMFIGYGYDHNTNGLNGFSGGTHEAILKFYFGSSNRQKSNSKGAKPPKDKPKQIDSPRFF